MLLRFVKGTINVNQLHDELLVTVPAWRGTLRKGTWTEPLLAVEHTATEIRLTVPDGTDPAAVQAVIGAHVPGSGPAAKDQQLLGQIRGKLKTLGLNDQEVNRLVS